jgi:hypothetical protein
MRGWLLKIKKKTNKVAIIHQNLCLSIADDIPNCVVFALAVNFTPPVNNSVEKHK